MKDKPFPLFRAWCHRDWYRGYGWVFGFCVAPWPKEERQPGDMLRALFTLDGFVSFGPWRLRIWLWAADPADRPIGHNLAEPQP